MPYLWNNLKFDIPAGVVDQTLVTLVDDPEQPTFTINIANDKKNVELKAYVDAQLDDLAHSLPGYASSSRVDDSKRVVVEHRARSPQGLAMKQRQAYVDAGTTVAIVTLTSVDKPNTVADAAFDSLVRSLS